MRLAKKLKSISAFGQISEWGESDPSFPHEVAHHLCEFVLLLDHGKMPALFEDDETGVRDGVFILIWTAFS